MSNYGEFQLGTDPNDIASAPPFNDNYQESFEGGVLPAGWTIPLNADAGFTPTSITASDGAWSLQSDAVSTVEEAAAQLAIVHNRSDLMFDVYLNSSNTSSAIEAELYIDDVRVWSEPFDIARGWVRNITVEVPTGYHEYRWVFDRYASNGCRCLRIDNIRIMQVDVDVDGMRDDWELANGLDPADPSDAALDPDADGLTNLEENNNLTDPFDADSDDDGLSDGVEVNTHSTDPNDADSDNDLIRDDFEIANGLDPLNRFDGDDDNDGDLFANHVEYRLETDPNDVNSRPVLSTGFVEDFEDPLSLAWYNPEGDADEWELTDVDNNGGAQSLKNSNDPVTGTKNVELQMYTVEGTLQVDYRVVEPISNNADFLRIYVNGSSRAVWNTQTDGWATYSIELDEGLHTVRFEHAGVRGSNFALVDNVRFTAFDFDQDEIPDLYENENGMDPTDPSDGTGDVDGDGLTNREEFWYGTAANESDSDGDGVSDFDEITIHGSLANREDSDNDGMDGRLRDRQRP